MYALENGKKHKTEGRGKGEGKVLACRIRISLNYLVVIILLTSWLEKDGDWIKKVKKQSAMPRACHYHHHSLT